MFWACETESGTAKVEEKGIRLTSLPSSETGVTFRNDIQDRGGMNIFVWNFLYTGSGVAAGDVNGDGLVDLYFGRNQGSDVLYINKGNFRFEDATLAAVD